MKNLGEFSHVALALVNEWSENINQNKLSFMDIEQEITSFINKIGHLLLENVLNNLQEPVTENQLMVEGSRAIYKQNSNLRFKDRFGEIQAISRRGYYIPEKQQSYYPLDEKLGMDKCKKNSPLLTYLMAFFGGCDPYETSAKKLSAALGFPISGTSVQNNTEHTGEQLEHNPLNVIPLQKQSIESELMIVEIDGTMSPRIEEKDGITGTESKKLPTEYKECNVVVIEKQDKQKNQLDRWVGAHYGNRDSFCTYAGNTGIKMGFLQAEQVVFVVDGAKHNWDIQQTSFPGSIGILDYYHAMEHLAAYCEDFKDHKKGKESFEKWQSMIYEGQILQVIEEMNQLLFKKTKTPSESVKHINYFEKNKDRMEYDIYRNKGFPIGSGLVEGQCKLVVGKRFKRNGMRWKKADNEAVLDVRLAILNDQLDRFFQPNPKEFCAVSGFY